MCGLLVDVSCRIHDPCTQASKKVAQNIFKQIKEGRQSFLYSSLWTKLRKKDYMPKLMTLFEPRWRGVTTQFQQFGQLNFSLHINIIRKTLNKIIKSGHDFVMDYIENSCSLATQIFPNRCYRYCVVVGHLVLIISKLCYDNYSMRENMCTE
jgi:hypothetical protein